MIELVVDHVVASDDSLLQSLSHPPFNGTSRIMSLALMLDMSEAETRVALRKSPRSVLHSLGEMEPISHLLYGYCLGEAMLDEVLEFGRSRKTFGKTLLSHQAVALRVSAIFLDLLALEQALDDLPLWAAIGTDAGRASRRLQLASELLLNILRNVAQVLAGHGYVDNEAFAETHEAVLEIVRTFVRIGQA